MGCVGEKATLEIARPLETREHRVQRLRQAPDLVATRRQRQAAPRIAGPLDVCGGVGETSDRAECAAEQQEDAERRERCGDETGEDEKQVEIPERAIHVSFGCGDDHRTAGGGTAEIGQRRRVDPQAIAADRGRRIRAAPARDRLRGHPSHGEHASAECQRPRDEAVAAVEHLDAKLGAAQGRVECAGSRQQRRGGRAQLGDFDCALSQRAVERAMEIAGGEDVDARAGDDDRQEDPADRGDHRAAEQRAHRQRPRTKPAPRTVSISEGSPSLRRRYETYRSTLFELAAYALPHTRASAVSRVTT